MTVLTSIHIYPLKGGRGLDLPESAVEPWGWRATDGDRPVPMNRFRPSVVVDGFGPWAEDGWRRIRIGAVSFRVAKPCGRCVVTTTDQFTGARGSQPLRMLARKRRFGQSLVFGQNLIPDTPGRIRVGDPVEITEYAARGLPQR